MKNANVGVADWLPKQSTTPRSSKRSSEFEEWSPNSKKDPGLLRDRRIRVLGVFILASVVVGVFVLSHTSPLRADWLSSSFRCSFQGGSASGALPLSENVEGSFTEKNSNTKAEIRQGNEKAAKEAGVTDDEECLSRTRHFLYRPHERQTRPSPALTKALQEYEAMHARCTAGKDWTSVTDIPSDPNDPCKYVVYLDGGEGLGNRFLSLSSAFVWALATDRVLLIDSRRNLSRLLCEPFTGSSWTLPESFPSQKFVDLPSLNTVGTIANVTGLRVSLYHIQPRKDTEFFCSDIQEEIKQVQWVSWISNQYYVTRLFMIPAIWKRLVPLFDDLGWTFTHLSRYLFLPRNEIWFRIERYYQAYLESSKSLVGLQVRAHHERGFAPDVYDRFIECLSQEPRLIPAIREQRNSTALLVYNTEDTTAIFVASLERRYNEKLKDMYIDGETEKSGLVSVHTASSEGFESKALEQAVKALTEVWLLSFSDSVVTSAYSTFGYVGYGIGAINARIVNTNLLTDYFCNITQSFGPCTHHPQLPSACKEIEENALSGEHRQWVEAHLQPCADRDIGLQLVS